MSKVSQVILFHGLGDNENSNWFSWLKCKLNQKGIPCFIPSLPASNKPNFQEQLSYAIKTYNYLLDENTILVGHSLGAILAKHFLLQSGKTIQKLILVGPAFVSQKFEHIQDNKNISKGIPYIQDYVSNIVNEDKVKILTNEYIAYLSKDDPYVLFDKAKKYFSDLDLILREFDNKGHFSVLNGELYEFEQILEDID